jgi:hypothetical protein
VTTAVVPGVTGVGRCGRFRGWFGRGPEQPGEVMNDSFSSSGVMNDSFMTSAPSPPPPDRVWRRRPQPLGTTGSAHSGTSKISTTAPATLTPGAIPTISTWSPGASWPVPSMFASEATWSLAPR